MAAVSRADDRAAAEDGRKAHQLDHARQWVVGSQRKQQRAIHVAAELCTKAFALLKQSVVYGTAVRALILTAIHHFDQMPSE